MRCPQLLSRIDAPASTSQPLTVEKVSTSEIDGNPTSTESVDRLDIQLLGPLIFDQRPPSALRPRGPSPSRSLWLSPRGASEHPRPARVFRHVAEISDEQVDQLAAATETLAKFVTLLQQRPIR